MATASEIHAVIREAAEKAIAEEPHDKGMRARFFVVALQVAFQGCTAHDVRDDAVAAALERLRYPAGRPDATDGGS
jgi:hypothetical protein